MGSDFDGNWIDDQVMTSFLRISSDLIKPAELWTNWKNVYEPAEKLHYMNEISVFFLLLT